MSVPHPPSQWSAPLCRRLHTFLGTFTTGPCGAESSGSGSGGGGSGSSGDGGCGGDGSGSDSGSDAPPNVYIAQCTVDASGKVPPPLAALAPHVRRPSVGIPGAFQEANLWASASETRTNLHYDARDNVLVVIAGVRVHSRRCPSPCDLPLSLSLSLLCDPCAPGGQRFALSLLTLCVRRRATSCPPPLRAHPVSTMSQTLCTCPRAGGMRCGLRPAPLPSTFGATACRAPWWLGTVQSTCACFVLWTCACMRGWWRECVHCSLVAFERAIPFCQASPCGLVTALEPKSR